jgi:hypothetical protein
MKRRLDGGDEAVKGDELVWSRTVVGVVRIGELGDCAASWTARRVLREKGANIGGGEVKERVATGFDGKTGEDCRQAEDG